VSWVRGKSLSISNCIVLFWNKFLVKNKAALTGALVIFCALLAYFLNFNEWAGFSTEKGDWGAFGDFVGGFSNPILTFITMCLLIGSINLQRQANEAVINQGVLAEGLASRQRTIDDLRSFESTFFSLAQAARSEFEKLDIFDDAGKHHRSGNAVCFYEEIIIKYARHCASREIQPNFSQLFDRMDERSKMGVFSCVRGFYITYKFACESCPEGFKDRYIDVCVNIMPVKLLNLVCLSRAYADWDVLDYMEGRGFFKIKGINDYFNSWIKLKP